MGMKTSEALQQGHIHAHDSKLPLNRPVVGVFVSQAVIRKLKKQRSNFRSYIRIKELVTASKKAKTAVYYFSAKAVNMEKETIRGLYWDETQGQWKKRKFPIPDVLYDRRGAGRTETARAMAKRIRSFLDRKKVIKINSMSYFNKWDVYDKLSRVPEMSRFIPATQLYKREEDIFLFLEKHQKAYLKAVRGGRGKQVMRVVKLPDKTYEISHLVDDIYIKKAESIEELVSEVKNFFKEKQFVLQKAIDLIQIDNSNVDFRAELQRDGQGELQILGISARVGQDKAPITIHSSSFRFESFLTDHQLIPERKAGTLARKVNKFLLDVYTALENIYGIFGEIGLDFGIDKKGEIWFIEPNAKSAKVSFQKAFGRRTFRQAFRNLLEFAKYLYQKDEEEKQRSKKHRLKKKRSKS